QAISRGELSGLDPPDPWRGLVVRGANPRAARRLASPINSEHKVSPQAKEAPAALRLALPWTRSCPIPVHGMGHSSAALQA
ncbi:MAG: hypothetical protein VKK97_10255, partial [Synechococcaceae cyanobacterium]|nr:hypothetical protein [Synechococcaceae cyanobacterium]